MSAWPSDWRSDWRWWRLYWRLTEAHGFDRAVEITKGQDPETNCDLAAWDRVRGVRVSPREIAG